jgi:hypothetical protein
MNTMEETEVVEMRIWCNIIGIVLVLHFNHLVKASAGGLQVPDGLYSSIAKYTYFCTCFKYKYEYNCQEKVNFISSSPNERPFPSCIALDGFCSIS